MAKFEIGVDLDRITQKFNNRADKIDAVTDKMLNAAAAVAVDAQKQSCKRHGHTKSGDMLNSIRPTKIKKKGSEKSIEVYPQGKDRHGVENRRKAFVLNYGRRNLAGSRWMDEAKESCIDGANEAMEIALKEELNAD